MGRWLKGPDDLNLTEGGIAKPLFYLSLPLIITNLLQTAYNLADTYWLGQYGTNELAAISFAFPMVFLFLSIGIGLSIAGSVLVAQNTGANREADAEYAASQTLSLVLIASIVLGALTYVAAPTLVGIFGAEPEVLPLAVSYLQIIGSGLIFMFGFFMFISLMRGYGDTVTPMLLMLGTVILNVLIDPLFIFGFGNNPLLEFLNLQMVDSYLYGLTQFEGAGIVGAAVATVLSRAAALFVGVGILLHGGRGLQINLSQMKPDPEYFRTVLRVGGPATIDGMGRAISVNLILILVGMFATPVVAGYGIAVRIFSVVFLPANAVEQTVETITGQNIGAGKEERARRTNHYAALGMGVVLSMVGIFVFVAAEPITAIFTPDEEVISVGAEFLRFVALTFGGIGVVRAYTGGFRGVGKTLTAAAISITMLGLVRLPVAAIGVTTLNLGPTGIWIGFAVSNLVGAIIGYYWFSKGTWRGASVVETAATDPEDGADSPGDV